MGEKLDRKAYMKAYREAHKERSKAYYEAHKERSKAYYESHKEQYKEQSKAYDDTHREQRKAYREAHKEQSKEQSKVYRETHKEQKKAYLKAYNEAHRKPGEHKPRLTDDQVLRTYYDNPDDTWAQLAEKLGLKKATAKTRIGLALMQECRESPTCPMKALLPEYEENTP